MTTVHRVIMIADKGRRHYLHKMIHFVTFLLLVVGGLNWLLFALFNWDIGQLFGGMDSIFAKLVYILVGPSAIYELLTHKKRCKTCEAMRAKKMRGK